MSYTDKVKEKKRAKIYGKAYRKNNKLKIRKAKEVWRKANPEKVKAQSRRDMIKRRGWTWGVFQAAKKARKNRCSICGIKPKEYLGTMHRLVPDHKHGAVPKPRGILCFHCNLMLGFSKERPKVLKAAAKYLENWSKKL